MRRSRYSGVPRVFLAPGANSVSVLHPRQLRKPCLR